MASSLVNNKYRITRRIGGGSFGEIYMGLGPNGEKVAVKFERHGTRCPQLRHEYKVYRELTGCHGFCQVYYFGSQDNYNVMVMDLLGLSLEDLFNKCQRRFSLKTVLQIADQMLERVDTLHSRHLIHRDIKPANFVIGVQDQLSNIFCVDFGLSKRYRHPKNLQHIPHRDGRSLTGTPRYASINNHLGIEQSRRDDLESIGYVLIYFLKGSLPWQGLKAKNAQKKYRLILEKKQQVSIAQLCQGCPSQFAEFLAYTRSLKFDAKPDIPYLRKLFRDLYHAQNCASVPKLWDWDGMDNDFNSVSGSTQGGGGGGPAGGGGVLPSAGGPVPQGVGLRPTTAAAIAMDGDMLGGLGMGMGEGDLDDDYLDGGGNGGGLGPRPNTAGAMLSGGYRGAQAGAGAQQAAGSSWGYARAGAEAANPSALAPMTKGASGPMATAGADYGPTDPIGSRRPHTAHGARAGFPSTQPAAGAPSATAQYEDEEGDPVVAGARGMMRYRRGNRPADGPTAAGPAPTGVMPSASAPINGAMPSYGANSNNAASWAVYQGGAGVGSKPATSALAPGTQTAAHLQAQQQAAALRGKTGSGAAVPVAGTAGWSPFTTTDRPKSATGMPTSSQGVPSTSSGAMGAGQRPASGSQQSGPWPTNSSAALANAPANTLSYGSLKNRFLNGSAAAASAPSSKQQPAPSAQPAAAGSSGKSKLFSLAR